MSTSIVLTNGSKAGTKVTAEMDKEKVFGIIKRTTRAGESFSDWKSWAMSSSAGYINPNTGEVNLAAKYRGQGEFYCAGNIKADYLSEIDYDAMLVAGDRQKDSSNKGVWVSPKINEIQEIAKPDPSRNKHKYVYSIPVVGKCMISGDLVRASIIESRTEDEMKDYISSESARIDIIRKEYIDEQTSKAEGVDVAKLAYGFFVKAGTPVVLVDSENNVLEDYFKVVTRDTFKQSGRLFTYDAAMQDNTIEDISARMKSITERRKVSQSRLEAAKKLANNKKKVESAYFDRRLEVEGQEIDNKVAAINNASLEQLDAMNELKNSYDEMMKKLVGDSLGKNAAMIEE